ARALAIRVFATFDAEAKALNGAIKKLKINDATRVPTNMGRAWGELNCFLTRGLLDFKLFAVCTSAAAGRILQLKDLPQEIANAVPCLEFGTRLSARIKSVDKD